MKLIIAGSRHFHDYKRLCTVMDELPTPEVIFSGKSKGTDRLGELYAKEHGIKLRTFPAKWKEFGKAAGHIRNKEMCEAGATHLLAFYDGKQEHSGTSHMIENAEIYGLIIITVKVDVHIPTPEELELQRKIARDYNWDSKPQRVKDKITQRKKIDDMV